MELSLLDALQLPFISRALLALVVLSVAAGIVGLGISFRELEFVTDGLVHAVFPGLVIGAAIGGSAALLPGALGAAIIAAVLFTLTQARSSSGQDAAIAVGLTGLFSLGVVLISRQEGFVTGLQELLFGHLLTVTSTQLWQMIAAAAVAVLLMLVTLRAQLFRAFDVTGFQAAGYSVLRNDLTLVIATALLVVAGVQAFGVLMIVSLLTVPMAVARLLTRKLRLLVPLAMLVPLVAGVLGVWASFAGSVNAGLNVSPGALVVLIMVLMYLIAVAVFYARRSTRRLRGVA